MNKFVIAAVAATLLASTSASFAEGDSGRETYQSAQAFYTQQSLNSQVNNVRDARAQAVNGRQAVKPFTAEENAWFANSNPVTAN